MKLKNFVAVRAAYSKRPTALAELDHANALRNGFTNSANVISSFSQMNFGCYRYGASSCGEAFFHVEKMHEAKIKKRIRSDFNALFEHVLIFSEELYSALEEKNGTERMKNALTILLERYSDKIHAEYGFEPLGFDFHLDEGHLDIDTNLVRRNIHAHVQFYNYDFKKNVAPLRQLMKKGLNENGQTNQLNPNFSRFQDIAAEVFQQIGFQRGISKLVTGREHAQKEVYVRKKLLDSKLELQKVAEQARAVETELVQKRQEVQVLTSDIEQSIKFRDQIKKDIAELSVTLRSLISATRNEARRILNVVLNKVSSIELILNQKKPSIKPK
jgi:hypothetical protein